MKYAKGDVVKCPPSGPHAGPRIGKVIDTTRFVGGAMGACPVLVKYIDYPLEDFGWLAHTKKGSLGVGAWVHPRGKIIIPE